MKIKDLSREDVRKTLRLCARREGCAGCPMISMETATRKQCFSALLLRAAEMLEEGVK